jgi:MYXO-CTERM domain-containing protein
VSLASYVSRGLDDVGEYDKALGLKPPAPKGDSATAAAKAKAKAEDVPPIPPKGKCGCSTPGSDAGLDLGAMGALALATIGLARRGARRMTRAGKR